MSNIYILFFYLFNVNDIVNDVDKDDGDDDNDCNWK